MQKTLDNLLNAISEAARDVQKFTNPEARANSAKAAFMYAQAYKALKDSTRDDKEDYRRR